MISRKARTGARRWVSVHTRGPSGNRICVKVGGENGSAVVTAGSRVRSTAMGQSATRAVASSEPASAIELGLPVGVTLNATAGVSAR